MFDHVAYLASDAGRARWGRAPLAGLRLDYRLPQAREHFERAYAEHGYEDCHGWHPPPAGFKLLMLELAKAGVADWHVEWMEPQPAVEFLVRLRRGRHGFASDAVREARRLDLLRRIVTELRDHADCPLADAPKRSPEPTEGEVATRLAALEARARHMAEDAMPGIAASVTELRDDVLPMRSVFDSLLPMHRAIARLRGRA